MENFGSEIGQKMRSAVKAKLLELGTGGSTGYIDDELPDYVMIMVANKRSKQMMITDLNLFLGTQTELFVTWLHEVLQKLQEVTLPAANAASKKRKTTQREEAPATSSSSSKRDKKSSKKDKKSLTSKKSHHEEGGNAIADEQEPPTTTTDPPITVPVINSITDVFAEDLLEKAKKTLDENADACLNIKKGKARKTTAEKEHAAETAKGDGSFDIPTIEEISSTTGGAQATSGNREHDLAELAEIQKKIYAAKKHLKNLGNSNDGESEDEDFLNLKDDGSAEEFDEAGDLVKKKPSKDKSPIVFNKNEDSASEKEDVPSKRRRITPPPLESAAVPKGGTSSSSRRDPSPTSTSRKRDEVPTRRSRERERREPPLPAEKKRSVHERLGLKTSTAPREESTRERRGRLGKQLYVPAFRRRELESERDKVSSGERERERERDRDRERNREQERDRGREREPDRSSTRRRSSPHEQPTSSSGSANVRQRQQNTNPSNTRKRRETSGGGNDRAASPLTQRQRIGSRVIVATTKPPEPSDDEDLADKPVNSVIKIKPRTPVSPSKQACKNLLLRAVAEAQRSTVLSKPKQTPEAITKVTVLLGEAGVVSDRNTKLFTKSYRDRLKRKNAVAGIPANLIRRTTQNLVIEVEAGGGALHTAAQLRKRRLAKSHQQGELDLETEEYIPESMSDRGESDVDYMYVPQLIGHVNPNEQDVDIDYHINEADYEEQGSPGDDLNEDKTQFVVTLNDNKTVAKKTRMQTKRVRSRSRSPLPQVSSSSSTARGNGVEAISSSTSAGRSSKRSSGSSRESRRSDIKSRLQLKTHSLSLSPSTAARLTERDSNNPSPSSNTPPPPRRSELIEIYRKPKEVKKFIINNDSEEDEHSPKKTAATSNQNHEKLTGRPATKRRSAEQSGQKVERSTTPPLPSSKKRRSASSAEKLPTASSSPTSTQSPAKRKRTPIKFDLDADVREQRRGDERRDGTTATSKRRSKSSERRSGDEYQQSRQKISIRNTEARKYENIPSLSSVTIDSTVIKVNKPKERCLYHPNCKKHNCDFYHPTAPCKSFPNCKYSEKCMYSHPRCKFDLTCTNIDCNYSHSALRNPNLLQPTAPPLSSHVVPVQNYKSISAAPAASSTMCKYYPSCTKLGCTFFHPKPCRFGKSCVNKMECNFYHHEQQSSSKFKWVASVA